MSDLISQALELDDEAEGHLTQFDLPQAERCWREALRLFEQVEGEKHPDVANLLNRLSFVLERSGRYREAAACAVRSIAIMEEIGDLVDGPEGHVIHVEGLTALGTARRELVQHAESDNRALLATLCHNLGGLEHSRRRFAGGEPWSRRAVRSRRKNVEARNGP